MKNILCFGDSNTWGYDPATCDRFQRDIRWTGVLRKELGEGCNVIEEGLNGRTTVWDDPVEGIIDSHKNGKKYLIPCLESHKPLDLVVIMLGTNDLKKRFSLSALDIAESAGSLVDVVMKSDAGIKGTAPKVLLMAPPKLAKLSYYAEMLEGAAEKALKFSEYYARVAQEHGCSFLDTSNVIVSSDIDGIHFEAGEHAKLGRAVSNAVREILEG